METWEPWWVSDPMVAHCAARMALSVEDDMLLCGVIKC
ncbi:MAG: hypothetical protein QOI28_3442 [Mycobacterium sp.]|jgi:hypothetical protein|nr:hypothetical protein [Mycobacterium sp.]MDT5292896.1 hypothetical protein [Mycobacterium sp.]